MPRANARKTALPDCVSTFECRDGDDFKVDIRAKDFPNAGENGEFRVYNVYGDVTKPQRLMKAIGNMLADAGIQNRRVVVNL
jgi:hypothetical protein